MSVQLTREQQAVVDDRGGRLLVSAAAGSGKTRVLVDRLFSRVLGEEKANVNDFLIITYTRAAAAELRGRIAQELAKRLAEHPGERHLQRQILLVYQADIKTIDAFCTALLRENVHLLDFGEGRGLTADFRVLDESEADLLRRRVLPRVLEEFYTDMTPGAGGGTSPARFFAALAGAGYYILQPRGGVSILSYGPYRLSRRGLFVYNNR